MNVHLSDENSRQSHNNDKKCFLEARPAGMRPVVVSHLGATLDQAIDGAVKKLERLLDDSFGRLNKPKGRTSFGDDQTA